MNENGLKNVIDLLLNNQHKENGENASNAGFINKCLGDPGIVKFLQMMGNSKNPESSAMDIYGNPEKREQESISWVDMRKAHEKNALEEQAVKFGQRMRNLDHLDWKLLSDEQIVKLVRELNDSYASCKEYLGRQERATYENFRNFCRQRFGLPIEV